MRALVSGQAATGVLFGEGAIRYCRLDDEDLSAVAETQWPALFAGCSDLKDMECSSELEFRDQVEAAWKKDRSLHLFLILLDADEDLDLRGQAAECLAELCDGASISDYVADRVYSAPAPVRADIDGAKRIATSMNNSELASFLRELEENQAEISERCRVLDSLPDSMFESVEERRSFYCQAIDAGAFRLFVRESGRSDQALYELLVHPYFRGKARARDIIQAWAKPFRESVAHAKFDRASVETLPASRTPKYPSGHETFEQVKKQKEEIRKRLRAGQREQARRFVDDLIEFQRRESETEQLAKSLCDLAVFAKRLGDTTLQLELAKQATMEAPHDAWSFGQLGDAERGVGRFDAAMRAFARAGELGDERTALLGRAEVLRDLGNLGEALALFNQCLDLYPGDSVAQNAIAAALADFGKFAESLALYDQLCDETSLDPVSLAGRAEVYRQMGRLEDALRELDRVILFFPDQNVAYCARGEVLREMHRLDDALQNFREVSNKFPLSATPRAGLAKVLKELGRFDEALDAYGAVVADFPLEPIGHIGIADVLRRRGSLAESISGYRTLMNQFPKSPRLRNSLAAALTAAGEYADARILLPAHDPASRSEWVSFHIRGMISLRSGDLDSAREVFEKGVSDSPWARERSFFETALAVLEVRSRRFEKALTLLERPPAFGLEPLAEVVRLHALSAAGQIENVRITTEGSQYTESDPLIRRIRNTLIQRDNTKMESIFEWECDAILLAA